MYEARNNVTVLSAYDRTTTFTVSLGATKLDFFVHTNDVYVQTDEEDPSPFASPDKTETLLVAGFHSLPYETPVKGFRFKLANPANPATVDWRAYG